MTYQLFAFLARFHCGGNFGDLNAAVAHELHYIESVGPGLPQSGPERVAEGMRHEVCRLDESSPVSMLGCYLRFHHSLRFRRQLLIQSRFHEPARGLAPGLEPASKPEVIQSFQEL